MPQRPRPTTNRPARRDSTRPPRGGDRVPYPGASPRPPRTRTERSASSAPVPASVWTCGPEPIDPDDPWPVPVIETITTEFSPVSARVVFLPHTADTPSAAAAHAVEALGRTVDIAAAPPSTTDGGADLVITAAPADEESFDNVMRNAAGLLRFGGILAVHTGSDWNSGRLTDPSGLIVAAAQNVDLLYLQHIVVLHTPIRDRHLTTATTPAAVDDYRRTRHRATVRGLPAPHLRAHSDILLFAQPGHSDAPGLGSHV